AWKLGELLDPSEPATFQISHVSGLDLAAERISTGEADILLLELKSNHGQGLALVEAARAAAPDLPLVILSENDDPALAVESLQLGAQDYLPRKDLDRAMLARSLRHSIERQRLSKTLQSLSLTDDLTGLYNRRGFLALAGQHLRVILRKGAGLLVYLDLDDLKSINDTYGHLEGNRALVMTASILRACFRQSDILGRLGGDEFCVLMTDAGEDSAQQVRRRMRQRVDLTNAMSSWNFHLSFSIGVAEVPSIRQPSLDELLHLADAQMYQEKRGKQLRGTFPSTLKSTSVA
ncbi:MAG: GGDEF domain-containing protein, partial [Candidatus Acidiferrales bacterium]